MHKAGVLINLPASRLNNIYSYRIPGHWLDKAGVGKRVLVDFAGKINEAFIIDINESNDDLPALKEIIAILDDEPLFDEKMLSLAYWMAEYYVCPLPVAIHLMIPPLLHRHKPRYVLPNISEDRLWERFDDDHSLDDKFFAHLYQRQKLSWTEAQKFARPENLRRWEAQGLIIIVGSYHVTRSIKEGQVYIAGKFDYELELEPLRKKAPRQAEIMTLLWEKGEIARPQLEQRYSPGIINSLLGKGYIRIGKRTNSVEPCRLHLNQEQNEAINAINRALCSGNHKEFLLYGVTGSGKTEVYLQAAQKCIANGKGVILLVPEIALTRQLVDIFTARIDNTAVLHSGLSNLERYQEWKRIKDGEARLVLGARSAVFAPLPDLGLIIIDEEQENTFKQEESPRYHARDIARQRARLASAVVLYGSATPSLETFYRARQGEISLLRLDSRIGGAGMPNVIIEDLRKSFRNSSRRIVSPLLQDKIEQCLNKHEQTIIFINRRGYSPMTICRECGTIATCPFCSVSMTYHRDINRNICHYCNYQSVPVSVCAYCGSKHLQLLGSGTQKVEEEIHNLFPRARIARLDMDSSRKKEAQKKILQHMREGGIDILVGTQMVAKGLDFPDVSLVGIIDADSILNLPDFRASERCFQLLVQAAGRAGRRNKSGQVIIQTFNPDAQVLQMAARQDYINFYEQEIKLRQTLNYPPFTHILRMVFSSGSERQTRQASCYAADWLEELLDAREDDIMMLGPAPCPISKIRNRFRHQILLKSGSLLLLQSVAGHIIKEFGDKDIKMDIDINPLITM